MRPKTFLVLAALLCLPVAPSRAAGEEVTLQRIMADPDWIGNAPEDPYWADDGRSVYYELERQGSDVRDLWRLALATGEPRAVEDAELGQASVAGGDWSADRGRKVYVRHGDLYLRDLMTGETHELTSTAEEESAALFLTGDREVAYRRGDGFFARDLESGRERQLADLRLEKDPDEEEIEKSYLEEQQERLFAVLRQRRAREKEARERAKEEQRRDAARPPLPYYLGEKLRLEEASLSPSGRWLIVALASEDAPKPKRDKMPRWVTEDGYVAVDEVRPKVGEPKPRSPKLVLLDLEEHQRHDLDLEVLPGIAEDPLKELREKAEAARKAREEARRKARAEEGEETEKAGKTGGGKGQEEDEAKEPKARVVELGDIVWSEDGARAALQLFSFDNKDRWTALVEPRAEARLQPLERLTDPAWIGFRFDELGFMPDSRTLWYLSEESGYAHLWLRPVDGQKRQLTSGEFEVASPVLARDGASFYVVANREHPGVHEVYRVDAASGELAALTALGGESEFALSPDESRLLLRHSTALRPPELWLQDARPGAPARRLTETVSPEFAAVDWSAPEFVAVPSTHGARPIHSRLYAPPDWASGPARPAVLFVHGAGYLQNAHDGWSYYFREFMFHTLLVRRGYVVLDMDYRASAGYGRAWRTSIYRQMGWPELEDLADGVAWLAANRNVDPARVGVYGGSYGGFLTLMALFREPDLFAAGAALRPVTDWAHYNHPYTSNILNTPEVDPEAYEKSSPIEFAAGLARPLLICHGMVDDNVVFQDTVRLVQRLIELEKTEHFETALYPLEPHGFREPSSWLDEYTRILELFETEVRAAGGAR